MTVAKETWFRGLRRKGISNVDGTFLDLTAALRALAGGRQRTRDAEWLGHLREDAVRLLGQAHDALRYGERPSIWAVATLASAWAALASDCRRYSFDHDQIVAPLHGIFQALASEPP